MSSVVGLMVFGSSLLAVSSLLSLPILTTTVVSTKKFRIIPDTLVSLPKFVKGDQGHGLYLNFMWVTALRGLQPYWEAYGAMAACESGFH